MPGTRCKSPADRVVFIFYIHISTNGVVPCHSYSHFLSFSGFTSTLSFQSSWKHFRPRMPSLSAGCPVVPSHGRSSHRLPTAHPRQSCMILTRCSPSWLSFVCAPSCPSRHSASPECFWGLLHSLKQRTTTQSQSMWFTIYRSCRINSIVSARSSKVIPAGFSSANFALPLHPTSYVILQAAM